MIECLCVGDKCDVKTNEYVRAHGLKDGSLQKAHAFNSSIQANFFFFN